MRRWRFVLIAAAAVILPGCQKSKNPSCSLAGGVQLARAPWPKFRADAANTGRALNVPILSTDGVGGVLFDRYCSATKSVACNSDADCLTENGQETCLVPMHCSSDTSVSCKKDEDCPCVEQPSGSCTPQTCTPPIGPVASTPIIGGPSNTGAPSIYLASSDGTVYLMNPPNGAAMFMDTMQVTGAIVGSPLLGEDYTDPASPGGKNLTLFVPGNGQMSQFEDDGTQRNVAVLTGFVAASPNIWLDGTVYLGTQSSTFNGICPNGIGRFTPPLLAPTSSTAAVVQDPNTTESTSIEVLGSQGGLVRAYNIRGRIYWSFFAAASVVSAVLVDETTNIFYVADNSGRVFAGQLTNGQPVASFSFKAAAGITASPALSRDNPTPPAVPSLYVADESGILYALDRTTGAVRWTFQADGPISSSPAVATGGDNDVIVFGADLQAVIDPSVGPVAVGGLVYAVQDDGDHGTLLWAFDAEHSIGSSSPSIGADGTVYIGRAGSRLGIDTECRDRDGDGKPDPCVVNDGGACYAIPLPTPSA